MRGVIWLIPVVLFSLSGPTPTSQYDAPLPTHQAAAPIGVRDGVAQFRVPAVSQGRLVVVVSALGDSQHAYPVSIRLTEPPHELARAVSPPRLAIRPYRPSRQGPAPQLSLVIPAAASQPLPGPPRFFDVPLLNKKPLNRGGSMRVHARPIAAGTRSVVYLDQAAANDPGQVELAEAIVGLLEFSIIPSGDRLVGPAADVDGDGRLAVLLTPLLEHLQNGRASVGGFVRADDFRPHLQRPRSNRCDMIYLNTSLAPDQGLADVLWHEYRHVLAFSHRDALGHDSEEDWLNEAIAHLAEPGPTNIKHRVQAYLAEPSRFPLVVPDYYRAGLWRCDGVRGSTFLFLDWCRQQHGERFVSGMLTSRKTGISNLVAATGTPFSRLFRSWSLAMISGQRSAQESQPAILNWNAGETLQIRVAGTATCYVAPQHLPAGAMVRIEAPVEAKLQVTAALSGPTESSPRPSTSDAP